MKIRSFKSDDATSVKRIYRESFAGYPWFEDLSEETISQRWAESVNKTGFDCLVAEIEGKVAGATWWDIPSLERLAVERGDVLAGFARTRLEKNMTIIWVRNTIVDPRFQRQRVTTLLKDRFLALLAEAQCLMLTRMRDDNSSIIHINQKAGFKRTGIRMPCDIKPSVCHEYWYLITDQVLKEDLFHNSGAEECTWYHPMLVC